MTPEILLLLPCVAFFYCLRKKGLLHRMWNSVCASINAQNRTRAHCEFESILNRRVWQVFFFFFTPQTTTAQSEGSTFKLTNEYSSWCTAFQPAHQAGTLPSCFMYKVFISLRPLNISAETLETFRQKSFLNPRGLHFSAARRFEAQWEAGWLLPCYYMVL